MTRTKLQICIVAVFTLLSVIIAAFGPGAPKLFAAPACYREEGPLLTSSISCPSSGPTVVYKDATGTIINAPTDTKCYLYKPTQGTTFNVYQEFTGPCSSLVTTTNAYKQKACTDTNGEWYNPGTAGAVSGFTCRCPSGTSLRANYRCESFDSTVPAATPIEEPKVIKGDCDGDNIQAGLPDDDPNHCGILDYIVIIINLLSALVGIVVVGSIIYGGIQYSMAGSDPQKITTAKQRIRNALIALAFFIFAYSFLNYLVPGGVLI